MKPRLKGDRCQCAACGLYFYSTKAFDTHRLGDFDPSARDFGRSCLPAAEMLASGWEIDDKGFWHRPLSEAKRARLAKLGWSRRANAGATQEPAL